MDPTIPLKEEEKETVCKKMWIIGFFGLPFVWFTMACYFWKEKHPKIRFYVFWGLVGFFTELLILVFWMGIFVSKRDSWGETGESLSAVLPVGTQ
ncbi:gamma-secretase subunit pen-2 [Anaeramoeba flamelloides]|uniref:Gamma-secretase subunit pen-2 n=1 Tax=Anaeramoeba flamelloides TaxID=1746091 RepID=A0AAV8A2D5_9EUKA|nr:gamma-secretase subunit pen-2 [Anaeramoeba flamelloides]KAJ6254830.1 gamma-secretase subunit pen-2 [Anaeramoeba flamelloides]